MRPCPAGRRSAQKFPPAGAGMLDARLCARARLPGRDLRRALPRAAGAGARRRTRRRPGGRHGFATTREMARWLALWMAFDDIVRVAELKSRASRARARARRSEGRRRRHAQGLRPLQARRAGVRRAAADAAARAASRRWDRRAARRPWALPLKVGSHTVLGMALAARARLARWLRKRGNRFAEEQALIERWLDAVVQGTRSRLAPGPRGRAVRPADQGLRRHQRARQGQPAARDRPLGGRPRPPLAAPRDPPAPRPRRGDPCGAHGSAGRRGRHGARPRAGPPRRAPRPLAEAPIRFVRKPGSGRVPRRGEERVAP